MSPLPVTLVAVASSLLGAGGVVAYLRLWRVDEPVSKANIELTKAQAEKTRAEAHATDSESLLKALAQVTAQHATQLNRIGELSDKVIEQGGEISDLRDEFRERLEEARKSLAEHGQWDRRVFDLARSIDASFPEPPPLSI